MILTAKARQSTIASYKYKETAYNIGDAVWVNSTLLTEAYDMLGNFKVHRKKNHAAFMHHLDVKIENYFDV